jgi:hypothetical protein
MRSRRSGRAGRGEPQHGIPATGAAPIPFEIQNLRELEGAGALIASFVVVVPGLGRIDGSLFNTENGKRFAKPRGVKGPGGRYFQIAHFEESFQEALLSAIDHLGETGGAE